jgi:hypothetical protein
MTGRRFLREASGRNARTPRLWLDAPLLMQSRLHQLDPSLLEVLQQLNVPLRRVP